MPSEFDPQRRRVITAGLSGQPAEAAASVEAPIAEKAEAHISSVVVHALPRAVASVQDAIAAIPGAEIHAAAPTGKIVVTLETASEGEIVTRLTEINLLEGVLSVAMVFHHYDSEPESAA